MRNLLLGAILVAANALSGCVPSGSSDNLPIKTAAKITASPQLLQSYTSGNTVWSYSDPKDAGGGHGTQVEYHAANGKAYLWYAGNQKPAIGSWKVETAASGKAQICYKYGVNTINPVLKTQGGNWECQQPNWVNLGKAYSGDVFDLASGQLPFVMPDKKYRSVSDLLQMMGRDGGSAKLISNIGEP